MIINLIQFDLNNSMVELTAKTKCAEHGHIARIHKDECPEFWEQHSELSSLKELFFSISNNDSECFGDSFTVPVSLAKNRRLAKHIINQRLYHYFSERAIVSYDYIDNIEVWVEANEQPTPHTTDYLRFSVVPKEKTISTGWELLVSFNGHSIVYDTPISQRDIQTQNYRVVVGGEVVKKKDLTPQQKQNIEHIYPVVNKQLAQEFQINEYYEKIQNRYTASLNLIRGFIKEYLKPGIIEDVISITSNELITIPDNRLDSVPKGSNVLMFGNSKTSFDPYSGLFGSRGGNGFGPYQPTKHNDVRFFFIAQDTDKQICNDLYHIFLTGSRSGLIENSPYPAFKPLSETIKQQFNTERNGSIFFHSLDTAIEEIRTQLNNKLMPKDAQYVAIYISPVNKDAVNNPAHDIYFKIKELLLQKKITSQVIYKDNPSKSGFKFHLPNIATAILAKIGGIPWQLQSLHRTNDLIIGIGAFKSERIGKRYIGSAFCFDNNGIFKSFDCYKDDDLDKVIQDIRKALGIVTGIFAFLGFIVATYLGLAYADPKKIPLI